MNTTDSVDYQALFEQVQKENEGLRIRIVKLKNEEVPLFERVKDKASEVIHHEHFQLYLWAALLVLSFVIVPLIQALFRLISQQRKEKPNEG